MSETLDQHIAVTACTQFVQFVQSNGRRLAYRSIGSGEPRDPCMCSSFRSPDTSRTTWHVSFIGNVT